MVKNFEKNLISRGFKYSKYEKGYYEIQHLHWIQPPLRIQFLPSKPINRTMHWSQNGLTLDGIGAYCFSLTNSLWNPDIMIFSFLEMNHQTYEYMIISTQELRRRLEKNLIRYRNGEHLELRLWLMEGNLYDTTHFGIEAEWYYLSKGIGGRMIDATIWNYTSFLNNWTVDRAQE